jgi:putative CocE/NonD family hydrolase
MAIWMKKPQIGKADFLKEFKKVPLMSMVKDIMVRRAQTYANHETFDLFWDNLGIDSKYHKIDIPVLHSTGWNDLMYPGTISTYKKISQTNFQQKIFIGPWTHNQQLSGGSVYGDEDFGPLADFGAEKDIEISVRWFDYHLKGIKNGIMAEPRAKYFLMGKNQWKTCDQFPPQNVKPLKLYLCSKKGANSLKGDGKLMFKRIKKTGFDRFIYNPLNPVPTVGGVISHMLPATAGIKDQRKVEDRQDVLVYRTEPLKKGMEIVGDVYVKLYVSSDSVDTDFTAKLVEVRKDGYVRIIEDGIAKTRFRQGFTKMEKIIPGKVYKLKIEIGTTAIWIPKGNQIGLEISSSNFPKYPRNPNTGVTELTTKKFQKATQTIYFSKKHPSCLILPVLPSEEK